MIDSITLHNWKSHEDSRFEFGKGTNILVGPMGSGKSTVLDALCFALFGNFPALQHRRVKLSDVIMNRPVVKDEASVRMELLWEGNKYEIERRIDSQGNSEARISRDGRLLQGPQPKRVNEEVERLLKIDYDLFTRAVYSEQNRIDYFLMLGRLERKKQIDELLGISRFEAMRSNLSTVLNRIKGMQEDSANLLRSVDIEKLKGEEGGAEVELKKLRGDTAELEEKARRVGRRRKEAEGELQKLSDVEKEYNELSERKGALERTMKSLEEEIAGKVKMVSAEEVEESEEKRLAELEDGLRDARKLVAQYTKEAGSVNERVRVAEDEVREREEIEGRMKGESLKEVESKRKIYESELNEARSTVGCARKRIAELDEIIAELRKDITKCPVCESPLREERRKELLKKRESEKSAEQEKVNELGRLIPEKEKLVEGISEKIGELSRIEERLKKLRGKEEIERMRILLSGIEEKLRGEEEKVKEREERRERMKLALDVKKSKSRIEEIAKEAEEARRKLGTMKFDRGVVEAKRNEVRELSVEESRLLERIDGMGKEMKRVEQVIDSKREERRRYEELERKVGKYGSLYENFVVLQNAVAETQRGLREELVGAINSAMEEIWGTVYPYGDYQGVRLNAGEEDYELQLNAGGAWVSVDGVASGGERSCASITMRMAFAMVLVPNLSWLILDEPTHNLDEEGRGALARVLNEHIPKIVEQVFVITHDESLKDAASARVYHLMRDKERSGPTRLESISNLNTAEQ